MTHIIISQHDSLGSSFSRLVKSFPWLTLIAPDFSVPHPSLLPLRAPNKKVTVILDMDETLVHVNAPDSIRGKSLQDLTAEDLNLFTLHLRPGAREFLDYLRRFSAIEIVVWSAGSTTHVNRCINLFGSHFFDAAISKDSRHPEHFWDPHKDMNELAQSRSKEDVVLIDNNEGICRFNSNNGWFAIQIEDFLQKNPGVSTDNALSFLHEHAMLFFPPAFHEILRQKEPQATPSQPSMPPVQCDEAGPASKEEQISSVPSTTALRFFDRLSGEQDKSSSRGSSLARVSKEDAASTEGVRSELSDSRSVTPTSTPRARQDSTMMWNEKSIDACLDETLESDDEEEHVRFYGSW